MTSRDYLRHVSNNPGTRSDTLCGTLDLLDELKAAGGATRQELLDRVDVTDRELGRALETLVDRELLVRSGEEYRLGLKFLAYGGYAQRQHGFFRASQPQVAELAEATGELATVMCEEYGKGVYLGWWRGSRAINFDLHAGERTYLHTTALGKAILAELPDERVTELLGRTGLPGQTADTVTDRDALSAELATIRKRGYATADGERISGVRSVAAAVTVDGDPVGAVGIVAPTHRLSDEQFESEVPQLVLNAANVIGLELKFS
jgi:DNA-binding IclR family transcriptional regulator